MCIKIAGEKGWLGHVTAHRHEPKRQAEKDKGDLAEQEIRRNIDK